MTRASRSMNVLQIVLSRGLRFALLITCLILSSYMQAHAAAPGGGDDGRVTIAVLDFAANNVTAETARGVSDLLSNYLWQTGEFKVMERRDVARAIEDIVGTPDGAWVCDEVSCAVDIGKSLEIHNVVIGTVSLFGDRVTVSVRVVNVDLREVIAAETVVADEGERGIPEAAEDLADLLSDADLLHASEAEREEDPGAGEETVHAKTASTGRRAGKPPAVKPYLKTPYHARPPIEVSLGVGRRGIGEIDGVEHSVPLEVRGVSPLGRGTSPAIWWSVQFEYGRLNSDTRVAYIDSFCDYWDDSYDVQIKMGELSASSFQVLGEVMLGGEWPSDNVSPGLGGGICLGYMYEKGTYEPASEVNQGGVLFGFTLLPAIEFGGPSPVFRIEAKYRYHFEALVTEDMPGLPEESQAYCRRTRYLHIAASGRVQAGSVSLGAGVRAIHRSRDYAEEAMWQDWPRGWMYMLYLTIGFHEFWDYSF